MVAVELHEVTQPRQKIKYKQLRTYTGDHAALKSLSVCFLRIGCFSNDYPVFQLYLHCPR
jgi:hypothetical protein